MKHALIAAAAVMAMIMLAGWKTANAEEKKISGPLDFTMKNIDGKEVDLTSYRGKVLLFINVASKCGFTPQYEQLTALKTRYADKGFEVLGFPANNFMHQEPGSDAEIKVFCQTKYNVNFPIFSKISVGGDDIHPLYKFLTDKKTDPKFHGRISWNFEKFLIGRDGQILDRFGPKVEPNADEVIKAVEAALASATN
jgi:glutathione peroxidase